MSEEAVLEKLRALKRESKSEAAAARALKISQTHLRDVLSGRRGVGSALAQRLNNEGVNNAA